MCVSGVCVWCGAAVRFTQHSNDVSEVSLDMIQSSLLQSRFYDLACFAPKFYNMQHSNTYTSVFILH